jgi:hypothetical protein
MSEVILGILAAKFGRSDSFVAVKITLYVFKNTYTNICCVSLCVCDNRLMVR